MHVGSVYCQPDPSQPALASGPEDGCLAARRFLARSSMYRGPTFCKMSSPQSCLEAVLDGMLGRAVH